MKKLHIITICLLLPLFAISQTDTNVLIIYHKLEKIAPQNGQFIKNIMVKGTWETTFNQLITRVRDSTRVYNSNCFLITQYDSTSHPTRHYIQGRIFLIDDDEKRVLQKTMIENQRIRDSLMVNYTSKDFELVFGLSYLGYNMQENQGFIQENGGDFEAFADLSVVVNRTWRNPKNDDGNFRLGLGVSRVYFGFYPLVTLQEANIANIDTIRVGEIGNWEYQLLVPMSFSIAAPNWLQKGVGIKLTAGVEYRHRLYRINTDNLLTANYDYGLNYGSVVDDDELTRLTNDHYNQLIIPYSLAANIGVAMISYEGFGLGIRYSRFIIPPFKSGQELERQFGLNLFAEIQLFNLKKR